MTETPEHKIDVEKVWLRAKPVWLACAFIAGIVAIYLTDKATQKEAAAEIVALIIEKHREAMDGVRGVTVAMERKSEIDKIHSDALISAINDMRNQLRQIVVDSVATRQAQTWIEMFRELNKAKYPDIVVPDLPR